MSGPFPHRHHAALYEVVAAIRLMHLVPPIFCLQGLANCSDVVAITVGRPQVEDWRTPIIVVVGCDGQVIRVGETVFGEEIFRGSVSVEMVVVISFASHTTTLVTTHGCARVSLQVISQRLV